MPQLEEDEWPDDGQPTTTEREEQLEHGPPRAPSSRHYPPPLPPDALPPTDEPARSGRPPTAPHTIMLLTGSTTRGTDPSTTPLASATDARNHYDFIASGQSSLPVDSIGNPWNGSYLEEPQLTAPTGPDGVEPGMLKEIGDRLFGKERSS